MSEEFRFAGMFYRFDDRQRLVPGELRVTPTEGAILTLFGSFVPIDYDSEEYKKYLDYGGEPKRPLIIGVTSNYRDKVTLCGCTPIGSSVWTVKLPQRVISTGYKVQTVLTNSGFGTEADIKFKRVYIEYDHVADWFNAPGINISTEDALYDNSKPTSEITITYKKTDPFFVFATPSYTVWLETNAETTYSWQRALFGSRKDASMKLRTDVVIEFAEPQSLDEARPIINHMRDFFSFTTLQPVHPISIRASYDRSTYAYPESYARDKHDDPLSRILDQRIEMAKSDNYVAPYDVLFTYGQIEGQLETIMTNWFDKADTLGPITDLYLGTIYTKSLYPYHRFLNLAQAIETYHRRTHKNVELDADDHQARVNAILNAVPVEYKDWLQEGLNYSNEPKLRQRLKELYDELPAELKDILPKRSEFIYRIVTTRNYRTHYNTALKSGAAEGDRLIELCDQLQFVLEVCILHELGFSTESIKTVVTQNGRYRDIIMTRELKKIRAEFQKELKELESRSVQPPPQANPEVM